MDAEQPRRGPLFHKQVDKPVPQSGAKRYFFLLGTHFWKFVLLNLLFVVFSLPIVTIPASICAVNRVCIKLIDNGNAFVWSDFWEEWKQSAVKAFFPGVLMAVCLFFGYYCISLGISNGGSIFAMVFYAFGLFAAFFALSFGSWTFVLIAMLPLPTPALLKNARALLVMEWKRSLAMIGIHLAAGFFVLCFFPISLLPCAFLLFSFILYSISFLVYAPVQEHIVKPYTKGRSTADDDKSK